MNQDNHNLQTPWKTTLILLSLAGLALLIRMPHLGKWSLTLDEYYYSQPVSFILERGIPELPGGGYYSRGLLLQYLTVLPVKIFTDWEFAVRILPLILGALSIPLIYLLSRLFLPVLPSILCSLTLLLSSWHIEFSRFARFYVPFQFIFLLFIYCFYSGYWLNKRRYRFYSIMIAFLSIFVYEGSIFLPVILLTALLLDESPFCKKNISFIVSSLSIVAANIVFNAIDFLNLGVVDRFPPEFKVKFLEGSTIVLPNLELFHYILTKPFFLILFILLGIFSLYLAWTMLRENRTFWGIFFTLLALLFTLFHQLGLLIYLMAFSLAVRKDFVRLFMEKKKLIVPYLVLTLIFWFMVIMLTGNINKILHYFVGYPPVKYAIIKPFAATVPLFGIFLAFSLIASIIRNYVKRMDDSTDYLLLVMLLCLLVFSLINTLYRETRYAFFLYPLLLVMAFVSAHELYSWVNSNLGSQRLRKLSQAILLIPLIMFLFTEDFQPSQVLNVAAREVNFRLGKFSRFESHWYWRLDYENPVLYVNKAYRKGDTIVLDHVIMSKYVDKPFVNYIDMSDVRFPYGARKKGKEEMWTGKTLIFKREELLELVPSDPSRSLWLVAGGLKHSTFGSSFDADNERDKGKININRLFDKKTYDMSLKYLGVDGRIGVWEIKRRREKADRKKGGEKSV